jgi:hypothetical protein
MTHPASFLEEWLDQRVRFFGEDQRLQTPKFLAKRLMADAALQNITLAEMGLEQSELERFMAQAMSYTRDEMFP